ncbi:MAG: DUF3644 domain-containing protein [Clostridiales Family XIII bacterium]|jgi:hypothetical protein|nr:DUF3644 domain-containing protein [Clostridiales Family XIII bacterium]
MSESISTKLLNKSIEAFMVAVETYNKPTIRYRVEGFAFFVCNAWELMLKAHIINTRGEASIYYKDNPYRTISLENCVHLIFTNKKAPLRQNLEKIIELRNTSTHFITEEYEMVYVPLFQSCVFNFVEKILEFHKVNMAEQIPQNFLTLTVSTVPFDDGSIRAKYPKEIAEKLLLSEQDISGLSANRSAAFSVNVEHRFFITKNKSAADAIVGIDNSAEGKVKIIKELKDPNTSHNFTMKKCCAEINNRLRRNGIDLLFNRYHFDMFCKYFGIKNNEHFCFVDRIHSQPQYSYSIATIDFIHEEICKDPENIITNIKERLKKR